MRKRTFQNQNLLYKYYRKFTNLQKRISLLMRTGEFYELSRDFQNRMIRRLKILYDRLLRLAGKQKLKWATAAMALMFSAFVAHAQFNEPVSLSGFMVNQFANPEFVDFDEDGDMDLIVGDEDGNLKYYMNEGGSFSVDTSSSNIFNGISISDDMAAPTFMDVDNDEDLDLVVGDHSGALNYFENIGTSFENRTGGDNPFNGIDVGAWADPGAADVDLDGDIDLIVGNGSGYLLFYENEAGVFSLTTGVDDPFDGLVFQYAPSLDFVDYDGDGDLDLFVGTYDADIYYLKNNAGNFDVQNGPSNPFNGLDLGWYIHPAVVDIDDDGDLDLAFGDYYGGHLRYMRNDADVFTEKRGTPNPLEKILVPFTAAPAFVDLDEDGDLDMAVGDMYGNVTLFDNTEEGFVPLLDAENPFDAVSVGGYAHPALADVDGDGDPDLVVGDDSGELRYFTNELGDFIELTGTNNPFDGFDGGDLSTPTFADLDGDGDMDLFVGSKYGASDYGKVSYLRNVSGDFQEQLSIDNPFDEIFTSGSIPYRVAPAFSDIDDDGDLDLFLGNKYGNVLMYLNDGGVFTAEEDDNPFFDYYYGLGLLTAPAFADVDEDGDEDLYVGTLNLYQGGNVHFVENTTDPVNSVKQVDSNADILSIYSYQKSIFIDTEDHLLERVELYSLSGEMVLSEALHYQGLYELNMESYQTGLYIVRAYSEGQATVKKVAIK